MNQRVRAAVFPVAGRGTRFLPATKANAKEMLPIVDKPLIQYAVDEAIAAGAEKLVFVTAATKRSIEDHFDADPELERALETSGKTELLESITGILPDGISCIFIRQGVPHGLGHAVLCARPAIGNEPFFVHLPDDLIHGSPPCLKQLAEDFAEHGNSLVAVEEVPRENTSSYGIVDIDDNGERSQVMKSMVEKPKPEEAPSTKAVVGRYLLTPEIWDKLENTGRGAGGEIQLTDAIADLLEEQPVRAFAFEGERFDCGSKLGYLKANVAYGLRHPDEGEALRAWLAGLDIS